MDESWDDVPSKFDEKYSIVTRKMMRYISEDSRISILELSKKINVSRRTTREKLDNAERELGIHYVAELNEEALNLTNPHMIRVKFTKAPNYDTIAKLLASSHVPQLAVTTKGTYDLFIYANATTSSEYIHWDKKMQIMLSKYGVSWNSSGVAHHNLGFFPLRNELLDTLNIDEHQKAMLKLLNTNARISFSDISKTIKMHFNTVAYNFNKLMKSGYIKRFTVSMDMPSNATAISVFGKYILSPEYEQESARSRTVFKSSGIEFPITNRYPFVVHLVGSSDVFITGLFDDYDTTYEHVVQRFKKMFAKQQVKVEYGKIEKVILGRLPLRSIDAKKEYNVINWTFDPLDDTK